MQKMDPQIYKLLEVSYEAWIDSGIDVRALRDSNRVGVYTGTCGSEVRIHKPQFLCSYVLPFCKATTVSQRMTCGSCEEPDDFAGVH